MKKPEKGHFYEIKAENIMDNAHEVTFQKKKVRRKE